MKEDRNERLRRQLREAVAPVHDGGPERDLWPAVLGRLQDAATQERVAAPWYDWALAAGVIVFTLFAPVSIPVLLYYL